MENKILVAAPTYKGMKYCHDRFFNRINNLTFHNYDILIIDNTKDQSYFNELKEIKNIQVIYDDTQEENSVLRLVSSRNKIIDYALEHGYSHILMLDTDVIPPVNVIELLLECDKPIVSGIYYNYFNVSEKVRFMPVCWKFFTEQEFEELKTKYPQYANKSRDEIKRHLTDKEVSSNELQKVAHLSAGCMLIKKEVFEKVRYGKYKEKGADDDIYFIDMARKLGFQPYCYTKVKCDHLVLEKYKKDEKGNLVLEGFSDAI